MSTTHDVSQPSTEMTQALAEAEAAFRRETPAYATTSHLDDLRATEYGRLDRQGHVYLDYTGGGLYAESQLRAHMELLSVTSSAIHTPRIPPRWRRLNTSKRRAPLSSPSSTPRPMSMR